MPAVIIGAALLVAGSVQAPEFNGLDAAGWAVLGLGVLAAWSKWARS